jgi:NADH dehydrogenase [ubiquinone] 1 alpha subcomplex assembly factor 7
VSALKEKIIRLIRAQGPISIAQYMQIALGDPFNGYYISRDPFGRDFVTAPEVSQIFGELIGLFFVQAWEDRGRPKTILFVELGPGRGTLMADMMRAAQKVRPDFGRAAKIILVETSPLLRSTQKQTLSHFAPSWALRWEEIPDGAPIYLIANEFFDALPIHQFEYGPDGWRERMVAAVNDELKISLSPDAQVLDASFTPRGKNAEQGEVLEWNPSAQAIASGIAERIAASNGVGLVVDYGYCEPSYGDSFQAVKANGFADPLAEPGEADLTAHVDFTALSNSAAEAGASVSGPLTQGLLLGELGIRLRADQLKLVAPQSAEEIDHAVMRLTSEKQMGTLFKAMALSTPGSKQPPGFPC